MGRRTIITDDLTDAEVLGASHEITLTLAMTDSKGETHELADKFEISEFTLGALKDLIDGDLPGFIVKMRPFVKAQTSDSAVVRKWARDNSVSVPEHGRIPADVMAKYRAATATVDAPDTAAAK